VETLYFDRVAGVTRREPVFGGRTLAFLYERHIGRFLVDSILSRRIPNHLYGWLQRRLSTRARIQTFVDSLGIDVDEAEQPPGGYRSLDHFFTRRLKPEARPIDLRPEHLISPADGRALAFAVLRGRTLPVKGADLSLTDLLGDASMADKYADGAALVIRLAPADYHRFHFPDSGIAGPVREIEGALHSVHPIALGAGAPSFRNKRQVALLETRSFGQLVLVEVGALCVGTIVQTYRPGPVERGTEKGLFRFGGSTIVVLAEAGRIAIDADLIENTKQGLETLVRMGTRIAHGANVGTA
jgi:phosphatidylserine decarboxylase